MNPSICEASLRRVGRGRRKDCLSAGGAGRPAGSRGYWHKADQATHPSRSRPRVQNSVWRHPGFWLHDLVRMRRVARSNRKANRTGAAPLERTGQGPVSGPNRCSGGTSSWHEPRPILQHPFTADPQASRICCGWCPCDLPEAWGMKRSPGTKPGCPGNKGQSALGVERQIPAAEALGRAAGRCYPHGHGPCGQDLGPEALRPARPNQVGRSAGDIGKEPESSGVRTTLVTGTARIPPDSSL